MDQLVSPEDHFKPYLRLFGPVVWILEALKYPSATFLTTIFGQYPKFRNPCCKIPKKIGLGKSRTSSSISLSPF